MLKDHNEDLTRWRWAKKVLTLPRSAASAEADLWLAACPYKGHSMPLRVRVNGRTIGMIRSPEPEMRWHRLAIPAPRLRSGDNEIILDCDAPAMHAWKLAIAVPSVRPNSFISFDRGKT